MSAASGTQKQQTERGMPLFAALEVLHELRTDGQIVVTTMGTAREWPKLSNEPLDFNYIPSAMGHAPSVGLGLALAQPGREVIVLNGDGCMLMNLGALVTIIASGVKNYTLAVFNNRIYEVTGGQRTAAADSPADFARFAEAAGFVSVATFSDLEDWRRRAAETLKLPGPRFIVLDTQPVEDYELKPRGPMDEQIKRFVGALEA